MHVVDYRRVAMSHRANQQRVVVTGLGLVTSVGQSVSEFWPSIQAGRSGVSLVEGFDASGYPTRIGGLVKGFRPGGALDAKEARHMARFSQFAVVAAGEALGDAGLAPRLDSDHAGVYMGCAIGGLDETQEAVDAMRQKGGMRVSPFFVVMSPANMAGYHVAHTFGARGYNNSTVTACAAGTVAIGEASEVIRRGDAEVMLAGGTEAGMCELGLVSFTVGRAYSRRNDEPERASRPFDLDRDGFVGGEGAGVLVLERLDRALERGARIYAEILGFGTSNDAYHLIAPDPTGAGALRAMRSALRSANLPPDAVDYVNAHATGTPLGDVSETVAIKELFGERAYRVPVSATKSMLGHLFGAAGAVEAITTILALRDGVLPPTINLERPDPECDLDYVPLQARRADIRIAMSNSFGLGGQNAVLVVGRWDPELAYRSA